MSGGDAQPRLSAPAGASGAVGGRAMIGGIWTGASQLAPYLFTTITSIVAARILSPDDMGRQSFISFAVIAGQTVCTSGLGYSVVRHVGLLLGEGRPGAVRSLVRLAWQLAALPSLVTAAALLLVGLGGAEPREAWVFAAVAVLAGGLNNVPARVLAGGQRWRTQSIVLLVVGTLSAIATVAVLGLGGGVSGMLAVTAAAAVTMLGWSTRLMRRFLAELPRDPKPLGRLRRDVVRFAGASSIPVVLTFVVMQRSEFFFLDRDSSDAEIAVYSIAFSTLLALLALPMVVRTIVIPSVAMLVGAGEFDRIRRGFSRLVRLSLLVTVPLTAAALALGPTLLRLVYGNRYSEAGDVLLILVAPLPLVPLSAAGSALLMGYGRVRIPTLVSGFAAAVDIAAAAVLVPRLDAEGAAIANVLALVAATVPLVPACLRLVGPLELSLPHLARLLAVSATAGTVGRLVVELGGGADIFAGAAIACAASFVVLALIWRVLPAEDADWIASLARGRRAAGLARAAHAVAN